MKGVFIWLAANHSTASLVPRLVQSGTNFVSIKIVDGKNIYPDLNHYFDELRAAGIRCGAWGYTYLKDPVEEARAISEAIDRYEPDFFLLDLEEKQYLANIDAFVEAFDAHGCQVGLCTYRFPSLHRELPYQKLATICQFATPQIYWRGGDPVQQLDRSLKEYKKYMPDTPIFMVAGEMFSEHKHKTTPKEMALFYDACREKSLDVLFWSYEQGLLHRDLWEAYTNLGRPVRRARVTAMRAVVRSTPYHNGEVLRYLKHGNVVEVFGIENGWANVGDGWVKAAKLSL